MDGADGHHALRLLTAAGLLQALSCDVESVGQLHIRQGQLAGLELLLLQFQPFDIGVVQSLRNPDGDGSVSAEVEQLTIGGSAQES